MWDNPTIHGILCPIIIVIRRDKGAPNFYANLQEWVQSSGFSLCAENFTTSYSFIGKYIRCQESQIFNKLSRMYHACAHDF